MSRSNFSWQDGDRIVRFGRGAIADAEPLLGEGYTLLTTARTAALAPALAGRAGTVHELRSGRVGEIAGELLGEIDGELLVALGGGRVIDTAKALAAAQPPDRRPRVAAIPTTLSAAEMTAVHRRAAGADGSLPAVRPRLVINDPDLSASQPEAQLAASAANALGHAIEGPATTRSSPVPALAGRQAARLIASAYRTRGEPDRGELALAALLSGYAVDACGYGLHHVLSQSLARWAGLAHAEANAAMLPHTLAALWSRGADVKDAPDLARDLARRAGAQHLRELGATEEQLDACADAAAERSELELTPPRLTRDEIRALYAAAC